MSPPHLVVVRDLALLLEDGVVGGVALGHVVHVALLAVLGVVFRVVHGLALLLVSRLALLLVDLRREKTGKTRLGKIAGFAINNFRQDSVAHMRKKMQKMSKKPSLWTKKSLLPLR